MTAQSPPFALQASSHSAELFRRALQSLAGGGGVVSSTDLAVSALGTPNMSANVAAGQIWIPGTLGSALGMPSGFTSQGGYYGYNDGTVNETISAANATNPRIDLVVASVQDAQYSGSNNQWVLQVVTGTPSATPAVPAAPANSVVLAQVLVGANVTSVVSGNITDTRPLFGTAPALGPRSYRAEVYRTAAFTVGTGDTQVVFDTVAYDTSGNYSTGTGLFTCPVAGVYTVDSTVQITPNTLNLLRLFRNGSVAHQASGSTVSGFLNLSTSRMCAAGDTLGIYGRASAASSAGGTGQTATYAAFRLHSLA